MRLKIATLTSAPSRQNSGIRRDLSQKTGVRSTYTNHDLFTKRTYLLDRSTASVQLWRHHGEKAIPIPPYAQNTTIYTLQVMDADRRPTAR